MYTSLPETPGHGPGVNPPGGLMRARGPHHATGLYAHITWHTWRRERSIHLATVPVITNALLAAAKRTRVRVHAQAALSDHVHVLLSFPPDATISAFVREAKSESARRAEIHWSRGYYAGTLSRDQVRAVRVYIGRQFGRHPDLVPS